MNNKKFNSLTTLNLNCNDQRWSEYMFCISKNLQNELINSIYIGIELDENNQDHLTKFNHISSFDKRVVVHKIINRPTFAELFAFCNNIKGMWIISNADIYFPERNTNKLSILLERDYNKECFVLTRYNILDEMKEKRRGLTRKFDNLRLRAMWGRTKNEGSSIDSWIFESPFDFSEANFDIQLGQPHCDVMMNHELSKLRKVTNPCHSVISIHRHKGWYAWYKDVEFNGKSMDLETYMRLMQKKGHRGKKIRFSHLPQKSPAGKNDQPQT